jgi:hypothetical protein
VGQPAEHHVGHVAELAGHGPVEHRVVIAVDGGPPGGHAIDQFPAVGKPQAHTRGGDHRVDRCGIEHGSVRMPHMGTVGGEERVHIQAAKTVPAAVPKGAAIRSGLGARSQG